MTRTRKDTNGLSILRFMAAMVRFRPQLFTLNIFYWTLMSIVELAPGPIAKLFFDSLTGSAALGISIWTIIVLVLMTALAQIGLFYGGIVTDSRQFFHLRTWLMHNVLARILDRPGANALPNAPGEAISYFRDDTREAVSALNWTIEQSSMVVVSAIAFIIMLTMNWRITLLSFIPMLIVLAVGQYANRHIDQNRSAVRAATQAVTGSLGEIFDAVQAIQVAGAEGSVLNHFQKLSEQRRQMAVKDRVLSALLHAIYANVATLGTGLILLFAAQAIRDQTFSLGDFALFVYYLSYVSGNILGFGSLTIVYRQAAVSIRRLIDILQGAPAETLIVPQPLYLTGAPPQMALEAVSNADPLAQLDVNDLTYHYPDATPNGITGINFSLQAGSFMVITGRIGAGKTTLLRAILGLLPASGDILWNGQRVDDAAAFFVPPRSAYTPQVPHLFSESLKHNLLLNLPETAVDLNTAIAQAVFEQDLAEMADGLETLIGPNGVRLSGGQVQRAAAARTFIRAAELLVFDDLSSALDVDTEQVLWERLFAGRATTGSTTRAQPTCLIVSHRQAVLARADHIIVLKDGYIEDEGY